MRLTRMAALLALATTTACASGSGGGLGDILGGVLGGGGSGSTVNGTVQGVDTRNQQVVVTVNGQTTYLNYDTDTRVQYQDNDYPVTALERGDEVTARVRQTGNNAVYTDLITVTRSVSTSTGTTRELVAVAGTVRQIDYNQGWFHVEQSNGGTVTIYMPYNVTRQDDDRFRALRVGNTVRVYALPITNTRAEFRQFY